MTPVPNTYDKGDTINLNARFYNKLGQLADPTSVTLKIRNPHGTITTPSPTHDGTGLYSFDLITALSDLTGRWEYRFEGTGAVTSAEERVFYLRGSDFS